MLYYLVPLIYNILYPKKFMIFIGLDETRDE